MKRKTEILEKCQVCGKATKIIIHADVRSPLANRKLSCACDCKQFENGLGYECKKCQDTGFILEPDETGHIWSKKCSCGYFDKRAMKQKEWKFEIGGYKDLPGR